jgi:hypothetical protein
MALFVISRGLPRFRAVAHRSIQIDLFGVWLTRIQTPTQGRPARAASNSSSEVASAVPGRRVGGSDSKLEAAFDL